MEIMRGFSKIILHILLFAGLIAGGSDAPLAQANSPNRNGQELATKLCARCHSVAREGDSPLAEAPPFRTFSSKWPLESLEEALAEGIVVGHPAMPEFVFEPEEIQNLLSYIASISR